MEPKDYDEKCSLIMLGDAGVGKSTISMWFKTGKSLQDKIEATIGFDLWTKVINMDQKRIKALIYDTSGQETFNSISKNYIRQGDGIIIVYDVTDTKSYDSITYWVSQIQELRSDNPWVFLIGNKADLEDQRVISPAKGRAYAASIGATFMETSYRNFKTVEHAYMVAIKEVYWKRVEKETNEKVAIAQKLKKSKTAKPFGSRNNCC